MQRPGAPSRTPSASSRLSAGRRPRRGVPWTAWALAAAVLVLAIVGGALLWSRISRVQQGSILPPIPQGIKHDPATRARGAVVTISGPDSNPLATYDPLSGTVTVRFQSRYYDLHHAAALNRQYLATEGRLVVQLILYDDPEISRAVAMLFHGPSLLATVTGTPADSYSGYSVAYAPGLP